MNFLDPRLPERFWDKVVPEPNSGCWLWTGSVMRNGYGQIRIAGSLRPAHRVSYDALVKRVSKTRVLDHLCRTRCCVNPAHLEPVTQGENIRRGDAPRIAGERMLAKTRCPRGHEYAGANLYVRSDGRRECRACWKERV